MQEINMEMLSYVQCVGANKKGTSGGKDKSGTNYNSDGTGYNDDDSGFWDGLGKGLENVGGAMDNMTEFLTDLSSSFSNWVDSNNITDMCASGHVDSVHTDNMTVVCK